MGPVEDRAGRSGAPSVGFSLCEHCAAEMPANAQYCMQCGYERRTGGPEDGADTTASGIIVVSTGGRRPVSHALHDPTEEVLVIDDEGRATLEVKPAVEAPPSPAPQVATAPPTQTTKRRSPVVITAVAVVSLLVIAAAAILLWPESEVPVDINAELATGSEAVADSMTAFSRARLLDDLSAAAVAAENAAAAYDTRIAVVAEEGDEELRAAATELLEAEQQALATFGATFADYGTSNFAQWDERSADLESHLNAVDAAQAELAALEVEELTATVDVAAAEAALTDLDRLVQDKQETFREWRQERRGARGAVAAASLGLNAYATPARDIMASYQGLRDDLADWTAEIDTRIVTISEAYFQLGDAAASRREIRNQFAALQPPAGIAAAHASLLSVVDEAIGAVESAVEGLNLYLYDPYYFDARDTPGWQTFSTASDRITGQFDAARAAWDAAITAEQNGIRVAVIPPQPEL